MSAADADVPVLAAPSPPAIPWTQLLRLNVGPFRGFRREEQFEFDRPVVLFYGPNGSGKTSLCEAIEYALLGDIEEAALKRVESLQAYFDNFHEGRHVPPLLYSSGGENGIAVVANKEALRFAIIEKNRIEGFARLAARTPAQANSLIATLFGLEAFNDFVNNFSAIDRQLIFEAPRTAELVTKQAALEMAQARLASNNSALLEFDAEESQIAAEIGCSEGALPAYLDAQSCVGRFAEVERLLEQPSEVTSNLNASAFVDLGRALRRTLKMLANTSYQLRERTGEISFRDLYRALHTLEGIHSDTCPACQTPLSQVAKNPFLRASEGLELLKNIGALESERDAHLETCKALSNQLKETITTVDRFGLLRNGLFDSLNDWLRSSEQSSIWETGFVDHRIWRSLIRAVRHLETRDLKIQAAVVSRQALVRERSQLTAARERFVTVEARRAENDVQMRQERQYVDNFTTSNADLLDAALQESVWLAQEEHIRDTYSEYLQFLQNYRDSLPATLLADLNETTRDFYNQFNADDHENDKLSKLTLPLRAGDRINVAFNGSPETMRDALLSLSEGHLRCLGLAILLAKNVNLGLPIIVFDDAVNAIDHDHRAGIRSTLFNDPRFRSKQILMTCHSNEFIKDIQNHLGDRRSRLYVLDHHMGDNHPRVQNGSNRHYLARARERLADGDQRQCLAYCRQGLENLTARLWKALQNKSSELGSMRLMLRSISEKPELRDLTMALDKNISLGTRQGILVGDAWESRQLALAQILAIPENHITWQYFNKGTHDEEDRDDFEIQLVRNIVEALEKISATLAD
jgi:predicted ATP-binding protein involved in virulence